jgi:hypothetical protein
LGLEWRWRLIEHGFTHVGNKPHSWFVLRDRLFLDYNGLFVAVL